MLHRQSENVPSNIVDGPFLPQRPSETSSPMSESTTRVSIHHKSNSLQSHSFFVQGSSDVNSGRAQSTTSEEPRRNLTDTSETRGLYTIIMYWYNFFF